MCDKNFPVWKFLALPFFKKVAKNPKQILTPNTAFSFDTARAKEKAIKKKTLFFYGALPQAPFAFLEKSEAKNYTFSLCEHSAFNGRAHYVR